MQEPRRMELLSEAMGGETLFHGRMMDGYMADTRRQFHFLRLKGVWNFVDASLVYA